MSDASDLPGDPGGRRATRLLLSALVGAVFTDLLFDGGLSAAGALIPGVLWSGGEMHRLVLSLVLAGGPAIAIVNLVVLWLLGPAVEHFYGRARLIATFVLAGIGAASASAALRPGDVAMVSAGGVLGLLGILVGLVVFRRVALAAEVERRLTIAVGVGSALMLVMCTIEKFVNPVVGVSGLVVGVLLSLVFDPSAPGSSAQHPAASGAIGLVLAFMIVGLFLASDGTSRGTLPHAIVEAQEHELSGDLSRAIGVMEQALTTETTGSAAEATRPLAQNLLAWCYVELGRHADRGIAISEESNRAVPENAEFLDTLGYLYALAGRCKEAEDAMGQAAAIHGGFARRRDAVATACAGGTRPDPKVPVDDAPPKSTPKPERARGGTKA